MKTERFTAACHAMQGLIQDNEWCRAMKRFHPEKPLEVHIAEASRELADALLAELAKTDPKEEAKPEADAEGWIVRIPTDPIPDPKNVTGVRFYDGVEHPDGRWPDECWTHSPNIARTVYITHYKPA